MAIGNPQANFNHKLQLGDIFNERVQKVTEPEVEWTEHRHGTSGNGPDKKTPGKKKVSELVVEMVVPDTGDDEIWKAFDRCKTMNRAQYCGNGVFSETDASGAPVKNWFLGEVWVKKIVSSTSETTEDSSNNKIRTVTFSVGDYRLI